MSVIEIRPRFRAVLRCPPDQARDRLREALKAPDVYVRGSVFDHYGVLKIPAQDQHYWSPQLNVELEEHPEGTLLRGLYGPRPTVWLLFVFLYSVLGMICLFVGITGSAQWSLGQPAYELWTIPVAAAVALVLYLSAKTGERLGRDQMLQIHQFVQNALEGLIVSEVDKGVPEA